MKRRFITIILIAIAFAVLRLDALTPSPKREFRGAWISTVYQDKYLKRGTEANKRYLISLLDSLKAAGVNAVLFQARPSSDAFYNSNYEPWSRFISADGKAPVPAWDPLQFIIDEAHARGMELHAWINPYRVTTSKNQKPLPGHIYYKEPGRFVTYEGDGRMYFDPGLPENRDYIATVIGDIVGRYDVDGIHFDDYFYPYPANGKPFPDAKSYARYGDGLKLADWRRRNVDMLIEQVHDTIRSSSRPWVRFGISPFGIWRNKSSDPRGSETSGLQNYDDLYADALLWAEKGWIDYLLPQLYWELEHKRASYIPLVKWWPEALGKVAPDCQLYIGQDVERSMKLPDIAPSSRPEQLVTKIEYTRADPRIQGNCWWPAFSVADNYMGALDTLRSSVQAVPALVPAYPALGDGTPARVSDIYVKDGSLVWSAPTSAGRVKDPVRYVVYRLPRADASLIKDPSYIVDVTGRLSSPVTQPGFYTVTALDHANNESASSRFIEIHRQ